MVNILYRVLLVSLLMIPFSLIGCSSCHRAERTISEGDTAFFLEVTALVTDIFEIADNKGISIKNKFLRINKLERFIDDNIGYEFDNGILFTKDSSLTLIVHLSYIKAYESSGDCKNANSRVEMFRKFSKKKYMVVKLGLVKNPDYDNVYGTGSDDYKTRRDEDYESLFLAIGKSVCFCGPIREEFTSPEDECSLKEIP